MKRAFLFIAAAALGAAAHAQTAVPQVLTTTVSPVLEVQRLAPQLVAFAGSELNFANLVNGLALGVPVTLTTPLATGGTQAVTFTPVGAMSSLQIAQLLETARQSLLARGIATPTAQQLATTLTGGSLATNLGPTPVTALVNATNPVATTLTPPSPATALQGTLAPTPSAAAGSTVRNMSDSPFPRGISDTLPTPGPAGATTLAPTAPSSVTVTQTAPAAPPSSAPRPGFR